MPGYPPEVIRDFAARFKSPDPIAKAEEKARAVPGFGEEIRRVEAEIVHLKGTFLHPARDELEKLEAERQSLVVEALAESTPVGKEQRRLPPRHRPPTEISLDTVKKLKMELVQRKAENAKRKPRGEREFTQEKIAARLGLDVTRVQQAEALERAERVGVSTWRTSESRLSGPLQDDPLKQRVVSEVLAPVVAEDGDREVLTARLRAWLTPVEVAANQVDRPDERTVQGEGLEVVRRRWVRITDHGSAVAGVAAYDPWCTWIREARPARVGELFWRHGGDGGSDSR
jgi:hypothetical protein